ncbi:MAG TPA: phosphopantothenoylcysteine decarboxylase [Chthoniobacterales bacterium]
MTPAIVITCGPASEPIDRVRRITNFSTGELGVLLAEAFAQAGHRVICCKGHGATWPSPTPPITVRRFITNDDLLSVLRNISQTENVSAIYHAAALTDFRVVEITGDGGKPLPAGKIPSTVSELTLKLVPAPKVLAYLRDLFPAATITAWKYEIEGSRAEVVEKGRRQIAENRIDASVLNGSAYGPGFGILTPDGSLVEYRNKIALVERLIHF